jgi:hypothetical protein
MKVARLKPNRTVCLYLTGDKSFPLEKAKISDLFDNLTSGCSSLPQPTAPLPTHINPITEGNSDYSLTSAHKVQRRGLPDAAVGASDNGHLPVKPCLAVTPSA